MSYRLPSDWATGLVRSELRRIPSRTRKHLRSRGLLDDLTQELFLACYGGAVGDEPKLKRQLHAAGERFRYHEIVRPNRRNVEEDKAGAAYQLLMYGEAPGDPELN